MRCCYFPLLYILTIYPYSLWWKLLASKVEYIVRPNNNIVFFVDKNNVYELLVILFFIYEKSTNTYEKHYVHRKPEN